MTLQLLCNLANRQQVTEIGTIANPKNAGSQIVGAFSVKGVSFNGHILKGEAGNGNSAILYICIRNIGKGVAGNHQFCIRNGSISTSISGLQVNIAVASRGIFKHVIGDGNFLDVVGSELNGIPLGVVKGASVNDHFFGSIVGHINRRSVIAAINRVLKGNIFKGNAGAIDINRIGGNYAVAHTVDGDILIDAQNLGKANIPGKGNGVPILGILQGGFQLCLCADSPLCVLIILVVAKAVFLIGVLSGVD